MLQTSLTWRHSLDRLKPGPAGQPMNVACCLLVAAAAFSAGYHNEYIVVAHLHMLIGESSTIITNGIPAFVGAKESVCEPYVLSGGLLKSWHLSFKLSKSSIVLDPLMSDLVFLI